MARCVVCDYSSDTPPSLFHSGLALGRASRISLDQETGEITCTCLETDVEYESGEIEIPLEKLDEENVSGW